ncbi:uncharacterized protein PSANT_00227 [Moesziomyces antarcticus]|uniref:EthD domain-containing protein n=1 Tax=Pseudozyma antarctica TaxID=84753 RepID=A0A5C3FDP8_PSEA2|nr:uncharacterized protein PSANT_00227 [Moesziomyces antarcticus]
MASSSIKQLVVVRRRSNQTQREYADHHFQVHGALAGAGKPEESPLVYYLSRAFDSAYSNASLAQPAWSGHSGATELYFRDGEHMAYGNEYTRSVIGPDGANFNDFAGAIAMFAKEALIHGSPMQQAEEQRLVALYYIQAREQVENAVLAERLEPRVISAFGSISEQIVANVALPDPDNKLRYFQGEAAPQYAIAYQLYLRGKDDIAAFRKAQRVLEDECRDSIRCETTFVLFVVRSLVFDQEAGIAFSAARQPDVTSYV